MTNPLPPQVTEQSEAANDRATGESAVRRQRQLSAYALQNDYTPPPRDAWHRSIGIFADDPLAAEVFAEVEQARAAERPSR
ncbi:MAG: hypothetical protein M3Z04_12850 [Chloroflexota bacterium]|nr:hypothetical protein [Chloroflexota bacterium]